MEQNNGLIDYIFRTQGFELIVDPDEKTIKLKDYDQVNQELFNEVSELKKHIFNMFIKGEDQSLKRIRMKLLSTRELLESVDFELTVNFEDYETAIGLNEITEINNLKIEYLDQLVNLIDSFSFETASVPSKKLKTNLTVKEIAYLFRALHYEGIIEARQKTDIFNFIAESFSSKQKEDISGNSIKNAFDTPDFNAVDFWQEKFTHFMQKAKKDKENLLR